MNHDRQLQRRRVACALALGAAAPALGFLSLSARAADAEGLLRRWPAGQATPTLNLPGYKGPAWDLASAKGKVVLLNFWASWCPPCRSEMPSLELLAERHTKDGLVVVAVNFRETDMAIRKVMDEMPLGLPVVRDSDGGAAKAFGVRVFPTTVAIGRDQRAAFSVIGEADWTGQQARQWIAPLL
jgi:thiol-disulfide isomerase/thioredoxin